MSLTITPRSIASLSSFHEKDSESQRIVIENLSKYLLRKSYLTNVLIGEAVEGSRAVE